MYIFPPWIIKHIQKKAATEKKLILERKPSQINASYGGHLDFFFLTILQSCPAKRFGGDNTGFFDHATHTHRHTHTWVFALLWGCKPFLKHPGLPPDSRCLHNCESYSSFWTQFSHVKNHRQTLQILDLKGFGSWIWKLVMDLYHFPY